MDSHHQIIREVKIKHAHLPAAPNSDFKKFLIQLFSEGLNQSTVFFKLLHDLQIFGLNLIRLLLNELANLFDRHIALFLHSSKYRIYAMWCHRQFSKHWNIFHHGIHRTHGKFQALEKPAFILPRFGRKVSKHWKFFTNHQPNC